MAETTEKKFLTLPRLQEYDALLKQKTESDDEATLKSAKSYADSKVNGLATSSSVDSKIASHNVSTSAHNDIRTLISDLSTKINNFLDVDDTTTDQLSEVLQLINNNKGTLESLTTTKINVSDIVNNLTTANASKVLSANQGVVLKGLIDALQQELDSHTHAISEVTGLQDALDSKAAKSHGTHVSYSTTAPVMDGTASAGSAGTVARSDHKHPTDTSRAAKTDLDSHTSNTAVHITSTERTNWEKGYTHSQAAHAPSNAEKNQNAFSNVKIGTSTDATVVAADSPTDTLTLVAGTNVTITSDVTNDTITITAKDTNTTYSAGAGISLSGTTINNSGVRSVSAGKTNGTISVNTNGTSAEVAVAGLGSAAYKETNAFDAAGAANSALTSAKTYTDTEVSKKADASHGHNAATTSANGFMTSAMVTKLNGIAEGATKVSVDSTLSSTSTNPVQNKVINSALSTATSAISSNTSAISSNSSAISTLQTKMNNITEITSAEIQALFSAS